MKHTADIIVMPPAEFKGTFGEFLLERTIYKHAVTDVAEDAREADRVIRILKDRCRDLADYLNRRNEEATAAHDECQRVGQISSIQSLAILFLLCVISLLGVLLVIEHQKHQLPQPMPMYERTEVIR